MTPRDREFAAGLCAERAGLRLDPNRPYLFESALAPVARREGFLSVQELIRAARQRADEELIWAIVESLAPAQTGFFRDPEVFDALGRFIDARSAAGETLRVWSAACGPGQEVYSLAMLAHELAARTQLFASDLSDRLLEKARAGVYSQFEVQRGLSARRLVRHFENLGEDFALSPHLRGLVRWRRVNLLDDLTGLGRYDLVLARYVLSGLLPQARLRALSGLAGAVAPGGVLVLSPTDAADLTGFGLEPDPLAPGVYRLAEPIAVAA